MLSSRENKRDSEWYKEESFYIKNLYLISIFAGIFFWTSKKTLTISLSSNRLRRIPGIRKNSGIYRVFLLFKCMLWLGNWYQFAFFLGHGTHCTVTAEPPNSGLKTFLENDWVRWAVKTHCFALMCISANVSAKVLCEKDFFASWVIQNLNAI